MKTLSILATSVLVSAMAMSSAHAMGEDGMASTTFIHGMTDVNSDGKISKEEFMKMSANKAAKEFMMMDMNDDGSVSKEEFTFSMTNR
ncbi:MAG: hypothetical protein ACI88H_003868 [Cocleimonas sp.]|jgi:hypothetical protein